MDDIPEPEWLLEEWLRRIQARWTAVGLPRRARSELLRRLMTDLATARAAGARIEELTATPPEVFADSIAAGLKAQYRPIPVVGLVLTCLGSGVVAAGAGWLFLLAFVRLDVGTLGLDEGVFYTFVDLFVVAAALAVMVVAARWVFRRHVDSAALTPRLAVALTAGTLVGFPLASTYGASQAYKLDVIYVVTTESLIVLSFLAIAVVGAQRWTTRLRRPDRSPEHLTGVRAQRPS